ncbi:MULTISPECIES: type II toxin-antitoxin system Phd/YefM family antitoxin [Desulfovibrio]|uniref:Antitoxin n=1 Tax=Desulfovibrio desulfuricans TaxID=876 RepID=A0AA94HTC7_DESDE|nr:MULTISPECIES: type II toxin-antitoxin system Phd/YefM family antitoxin [Desulfovibrio]ATD80509.1 type II toxin-antitoxin system Phd/YefM family antitoxin [Desulfovibrio sp. G11]SFW54201.1 prevent-host-death family protein [Desulfovibrio desulfuricans]SPD35997.1 Toxin-antitoxin system, type II, Phd/YefM antitoxin [Desulfovibrio sp. G11]
MNTQDIQSLSHFRANATTMVKKVRETGNPLILTQNGKAAAVVVSPEEWESTQESLAMLQLLALRLDEVKNERTVDFDEGMDQIDAMIEAQNGE